MESPSVEHLFSVHLLGYTDYILRALSAISLVGLLFLTSCFNTDDVRYKEIVVHDKYQLRIPETMQKSNELHDFAHLQYSDEQQGYFLIGIDEPKEDLRNLQLHYQLEDYSHFVTKTVSQGLDTVNVSTVTSHEINGLPCISTDLFGAMTAKEEPLEVYYRLMVLESPSNFYQLIAWSARSRYQHFNPIADEIECSFRELELAMVTPGDSIGNGGNEPASAGSAAETADQQP